jgi:hypothetical protein
LVQFYDRFSTRFEPGDAVRNDGGIGPGEEKSIVASPDVGIDGCHIDLVDLMDKIGNQILGCCSGSTLTNGIEIGYIGPSSAVEEISTETASVVVASGRTKKEVGAGIAAIGGQPSGARSRAASATWWSCRSPNWPSRVRTSPRAMPAFIAVAGALRASLKFPRFMLPEPTVGG